MKEKFLSMFDKGKFNLVFKLTLILVFVVIICNVIDITYSRYESSANMEVKASVAMFLIEQGSSSGSISLEGLEPSSEPYIYKIKVQNFKDTTRTNVDLNYHIKFETTTNLPLTYSVYYNEDYGPDATDIITSTDYRQDDDVYYKVLDTTDDYLFNYDSNETDYFTIVINYPETYKLYPVEYQGKIDLLTVIVTASQVI